MNDYPSPRQAQILQWLKQDQNLSIDDLVKRLGVSLMTVHRDVDSLVAMGYARKFHGGVAFVEEKPVSVTGDLNCRLCSTQVSDRTAVSIQTVSEQKIMACCPHCALLILANTQGVVTALARDFIYGRAVNVLQAGFLLDCQVAVCCEPSVLCFCSVQDAQRFSQGFGGHVLDYTSALTHITHHHKGSHH